MSRKEELPCEGLQVTFIDRILDVTYYVQQHWLKIKTLTETNYLSPSYLETVAKRFAKAEKIKTDESYTGTEAFLWSKQILPVR